MRTPISDEALSIVCEMVNLGTPSVVLPPHVVEEMIARIDHQDRLILAYAMLVDRHDEYLCEVDKTTVVHERLLRLEKAREAVAALEH